MYFECGANFFKTPWPQAGVHAALKLLRLYQYVTEVDKNQHGDYKKYDHHGVIFFRRNQLL